MLTITIQFAKDLRSDEPFPIDINKLIEEETGRAVVASDRLLSLLLVSDATLSFQLSERTWPTGGPTPMDLHSFLLKLANATRADVVAVRTRPNHEPHVLRASYYEADESVAYTMKSWIPDLPTVFPDWVLLRNTEEHPITSMTVLDVAKDEVAARFAGLTAHLGRTDRVWVDPYGRVRADLPPAVGEKVVHTKDWISFEKSE